MLELSLTLGILLYLSFGTVEFGHYFFLKNSIQGAAREGARAAIPPGAANSDVTTAVNNSLNAAGLPTNKFTIQVRNIADDADVSVATQAAGTPILVKVTVAWGDVGLRPMGLIDKTKVVKASAVMRKE